MGLAYGGYVPLQRLIYPIYYGRAHLGAIRGAMRPAITLASAAGPLVIAGIYDIQGSYALAFCDGDGHVASLPASCSCL